MFTMKGKKREDLFCFIAIPLNLAKCKILAGLRNYVSIFCSSGLQLTIEESQEQGRVEENLA